LDRCWLTGTSLQRSFFELEMYWTGADLQGLHYSYHFLNWKCIGQTLACRDFITANIYELEMYWTDASILGLHYSYHFLNWKCIGQTLAYRDFITAIIFWIGNVLDRCCPTGTSLQLSFFELEMYWTDAGLQGLHYS